MKNSIIAKVLLLTEENLCLCPILFISFLLCFLSCDSKGIVEDGLSPPCDQPLLEKVNFYTVADLNFDVFENAGGLFDTFYNKTYNATKFLDSFYLPWASGESLDRNEKDHVWNEYFTYENGIAASSPCYTGNYRQYSERYLQIMRDNIPRRADDFLNITRYGITTGTADLRTLPTDEFCFKSVRNAGEGYPFDYLQHTTLWIGTPIAILGTSSDRLWYFVGSPYGLGWLHTSHVALVNKTQRELIKSSNKVIVMEDDIIITGKSSTQRFYTGTILPSDPQTQHILIPTKSYPDNNLILDRVEIKSPLIQSFPVEFNKENAKTLLSAMIEGKYSWGGLGGGRDCSSTLKDYFSAFGIWLPRNSKQQRFSGATIDLTNLSKEEKDQRISERGLPYLSTLYMPGHIVLYLGENANSTSQIYHTVWGMKPYFTHDHLSTIVNSRDHYGLYGVRPRDNNQVETRLVIGKTVITDIEPEALIQEMDDVWVVPFLEYMETMTNVTIKN